MMSEQPRRGAKLHIRCCQYRSAAWPRHPRADMLATAAGPPGICVQFSLFHIYQLTQNRSDRIHAGLGAIVIGALDKDSSISVSQAKLSAF
jgi:hypothetical protein